MPMNSHLAASKISKNKKTNFVRGWLFEGASGLYCLRAASRCAKELAFSGLQN